MTQWRRTVLDENQFWSIIHRACQGEWIVLAPEDGDDDAWDEFRWYRPLVDELKQLAPEDIVQFQYCFEKKMNATYTWDHWGAMRLLTGSESDNRFTFFRAWLVCMGRAVYEAALVDPDSLADVVDPAWEHDFTPGFCAPGENAWEELGLKRADFRTAYAALGEHKDPKITGPAWPDKISDAVLRQRYPRLLGPLGFR